jgi:hypothetical protein
MTPAALTLLLHHARKSDINSNISASANVAGKPGAAE